MKGARLQNSKHIVMLRSWKGEAMADVKIPYDIYCKLILYHLLDKAEEERDIKAFLRKKVDSMAKREVYTKSKIGETEEERELYRQKYLDIVGMHADFRW
jgi:hypothetical protein